MLLVGSNGALEPEILPGVACALGAAVLVAFGTVALRSRLGLPR